jgi:cyclophilin family peptidyl-prolyl cis-trans isomerase/protein-disulfide isomerase
MRKSVFIAVLIITLALSACAPAATAVPTLAATEAIAVPTNTKEVTATASATPSPTPEPTITIPKSGPATCTVVPVVPIPDPKINSYLPEVSDKDWAKGSENATVTIIEYGDFQDEDSARISTILQQLLEKYPDDVRLVFRHYPLSERYDKDQLAAQAAEAAGLQGKFWQYHNLLFTNQANWSKLTTDDFTSWAYEKAAELGLDAEKFKQDMLSGVAPKKVNANRQEIEILHNFYNFLYDPILFINDSPISPSYDLESLTNKVNYFLLAKKAYTECPPYTVDPTKTYIATLHTDKGDIAIELYPDKAPWAVNSFVFLAQNGWYEGSAFYRVIPGFHAQAGDPSNSGLGNPGYSFSDELTPDLHFNKPGVVAMANSGVDTNGSQFFITYTAVPSLDGKYTIFGQVVSGMDVLTMLRPRDPDTDAILLPPDPINSITIEVK